MFKGKPHEYFDGVGGGEEKPAPVKPKEAAPEDGDGGKQLTIHVHDKGGKLHSSIDKHDGLPPDEMDHDGAEDMKAAHAQALEEQFGQEPTEEAEEKVSPGVHKKVGDYLSRVQEKE